MTSLRDRLRAMPSFPSELPEFAVDAAPSRPLPLLIEWLEEAIDAGVRVPHAATLSTVGRDGAPNARTLIVKDVSTHGVLIATRTDGAKVAELEATPSAALTFFWRETGRQVRVRGAVRRESEEVALADESARPRHSRAAGRIGTQSAPLSSRADYVRLLREEVGRIEAGDTSPSGRWAVFTVIPEVVEFWAATTDEGQIRLAYTRDGEEWHRSLLWP